MSIEDTKDDVKEKVSNNFLASQNKPNVLMELEDLQISSNYEIRPSLQNTFKISKIKEILHNVLQEFLGGKIYSQSESSKWTTYLADEASTRIKNLYMKRYKHIVQVTLGQQTGAGCRYIARCKWDAESDSQISEYFTNETIFCVIVVFGIYLY